MKYVIIKFYGNEIDGDWHDIHLENGEYEEDMVKIHSYAEQNDSRLFVALVTNNGLEGPPVNSDVFAEVEYTEELSEEEKNEYVKFLRKFSKTAEIKRRALCDYERLTMVSFKKIDADIRII